MAEWGWRLPFLLRCRVGLSSCSTCGGRCRRRCTRRKRPGPSRRARVWSGVRKHWLGLLAIIFVVGAAQAYNYAWNVGLPSLARGAYGENSTTVFAMTTILGVVLLVGSLVTGAVADRVKPVPRIHRRPAGRGAVSVLDAAVHRPGDGRLRRRDSRRSVSSWCEHDPLQRGVDLADAEVLPGDRGCVSDTASRSPLFGGTASYLLVWLQSRDSWVFPVYVAALSAISVVLYLSPAVPSGIFAGK